ncbi:MAG TPA: hypothetical protein VF748_16030 [Candidatus Acidoferrum sp.]
MRISNRAKRDIYLWILPSLSIVNAALALLNSRHHNHASWMAGFNGFVAGFAGTAFLRRLARYVVKTRAQENLEKVVKAVGGTFFGPMNVTLPLPGGISFQVGPGQVTAFPSGLTTCYQWNEPIPHEEGVASALLLLKNDPIIFWDWLHRNGYRTKSSGVYLNKF